MFKKMFESSASRSDDERGSPSPEQRREMPMYGRSPAPEPPTTADQKAQSPVARGKENGADLSADANSGVGLPSSPAASSTKSGNLLPSQIKSQSSTSPFPVQTSVLGPRHSRSVDKPSPVYVNRKSPQQESVDGKKQNSSAVGCPSPPQTRKSSEKVSVPVKSDPASSFSQDENEAPTSSSLTESRAAPRRAVKSRPSYQRAKVTLPDSDTVSTTKTKSPKGGLSRNHKDSAVVIQDERESGASGSTSARSSLSVDELSSVPFRALKASREEDRRRQILAQRMSHQHAVKGRSTKKPKQLNEEKEALAVASKAKAPSRLSVVSSTASGYKEEAAAQVSVVSHEKKAAPEKKSRNQLFEVARHRNTTSPSPLTLASTSSDTLDKPETSKPHPENDSASRMAILAKGHRRLSKSFAGIIPSSSIDTTGSDEVSVSTQETPPKQASKRASRMAALAAKQQRHSPAPTALKKMVDASKEKGQTESNTKQTQGTDYRGRPAMGRSRSSRRMAALSSNVNKSAPPQVPQAEATKTDGKEKHSDLGSKGRTPSAVTS
jgi:hypothetical protein